MRKEELFYKDINKDDFEIIDNEKENISAKKMPPKEKKQEIIIAEDDEYEYLYDDPDEDYDDEYELVYVDENGNVLEVIDDAEIVSTPAINDNFQNVNNDIFENEGFDADNINVDLSIYDNISNSSKDINISELEKNILSETNDNIMQENLIPKDINRNTTPKNYKNASNSGINNTVNKNETNLNNKKRKISVETKINIVGILTILTVLITLTIIIYSVLSGENTTINPKNNIANNDAGNKKTGDNNQEKKDNGDSNTEDSDINYDSTVNKDYFSLIFGGDVLLSESMVSAYEKKGTNITNILNDNILEEFLEADVAMVNEEFPFSLRGDKMIDKQFTFRTNPKYISIFTEMGLDIVSLANNHSLDYGVDALTDTFTTLSAAKIQYVGAGINLEEAEQTRYFQKNGIDVAILSASRVIPVTSWNATNTQAGLFTTYNSTPLVNKIKEAENEVDFTVVYVHWGIENKDYPELYQKKLAYEYIDAGADLVIGCHTHCLQGMEYYNGKPIVYSMGNFMFSSEIDKTMALKVNIHKDNNVEVQIIPCKSNSYCTYRLDQVNDIMDFFDYYRGISYGVKFDDNGFVRR